MPVQVERPRGRARTRTLLTVGGAAAAIAAAIALGSAGVFGSRPDSSPHTVDTLAGVPADHVPASGLMQRGSNVPSDDTRSSHRKIAEADEVSGGAKGVNAARNRTHVDEPHALHELPQRPALAAPAANHRPSRPEPRPKRAASHPHHEHPTPPGRGTMPSLLEMQCDEMFPAHKQEFRVRNIACHSLLGS